MPHAPVKIGFLGGGMISQIAHLPFYQADPRCEIAAIAEERRSLHPALAAFAGAGEVTTDHRAMLARADIDAVVISAPRPATGPLTLAALEAGKHVLAEKPMAHTADQARRLVEEANRRGLTYAVGFMKLYDPGVARARALLHETVASGRLGRLLFARFYDFSKSYAHPIPPHVRPQESRSTRFETWPVTPGWLPSAWNGLYPWFVNAAIHDVNLIHHFLGEDVVVRSAFASGGEMLSATLMAGDVPVALEIAKAEAGRWFEGAEFLFEKGRIAVAIPSPMDTSAVSRVTLDDASAAERATQVETGLGWSFALQARGFVDALTGKEPPRAPAAMGLRDMELTEAIFRSLGEAAPARSTAAS
ncbi:MAG TPA: Gfo/Idh/MocA family oxidoreductase [Bosea sp. (in: a-proteobacteria)]|jgi:predicted dehydrogenase|uniref:Gfo/Idh/MocA family protein n=1 Tax=Bosea sp. (in: a-proteobacteria) TaxID=1871050 RepID=UPI002DDD3E4B|nr:Gfo/Idh/MocA family oxidoreductase [Bosea sp. (in: a-proteobacteria)]HEV2552964.1 Gfo/Idh/MocA family oxidoreductase [Bosea sp. (in: a-proteobacteria)]